MSTDAPTDDEYAAERFSLTEFVDVSELGQTVLFVGPAMAGKQHLAIDLLGNLTRASGHPFAVTTTETPEQLKTMYRQHVSGGIDLRELVVIECLPDQTGADAAEAVYAAGSPGDLSGIAMAVADAVDDIGRTGGPRLLVDNLATLLFYATIETATRFVHALMGHVTQQDGILVGTLDTDGIDAVERETLTHLFETVVEVRHRDGATEFRLADETNGWQCLDARGGGE